MITNDLQPRSKSDLRDLKLTKNEIMKLQRSPSDSPTAKSSSPKNPKKNSRKMEGKFSRHSFAGIVNLVTITLVGEKLVLYGNEKDARKNNMKKKIDYLLEIFQVELDCLNAVLRDSEDQREQILSKLHDFTFGAQDDTKDIELQSLRKIIIAGLSTHSSNLVSWGSGMLEKILDTVDNTTTEYDDPEWKEYEDQHDKGLCEELEKLSSTKRLLQKRRLKLATKYLQQLSNMDDPDSELKEFFDLANKKLEPSLQMKEKDQNLQSPTIFLTKHQGRYYDVPNGK